MDPARRVTSTDKNLPFMPRSNHQEEFLRPPLPEDLPREPVNAAAASHERKIMIRQTRSIDKIPVVLLETIMAQFRKSDFAAAPVMVHLQRVGEFDIPNLAHKAPKIHDQVIHIISSLCLGLYQHLVKSSHAGIYRT